MIPVLTNDPENFPDPNLALKEPNGLLAMGGDLSPKRLLAAYRQGIFPWYEQEPILWWSPDPRAVLFLNDLHISTSMRKLLRKQAYRITMDEHFSQVIKQCAKLREYNPGTWLTNAMQCAYLQIHELGYAHSVEVCKDNVLVGGIYGVSLGKMFFGESMFSLEPNTSKIALIYLVKQLISWSFDLIDCQIGSKHLASLGATTIPRHTYLQRLAHNNKFDTKIGKWEFIESPLFGSMAQQK